MSGPRRKLALEIIEHIVKARVWAEPLPPSEALVEHVARMLPPIPSERPRPRHVPLAAYGELWQKRFGTNSEPPWKELAQQVPAAERKVGHDEAVLRWANFLARSSESRFARPARWVQGLGEYGAPPPRF